MSGILITMKILFFEIAKGEREVLSKEIKSHDVTFFEEKLTEETMGMAKDADIISVFVKSSITKVVIDSIPGLKFISTRSTGFDHIDTEYAKSRGIEFANVPAYGSRTVAEFAFALLLNISRKTSFIDQEMKTNKSPDLLSFRGFDLYEKTLGVIGTGKIGKNVVKIAKGFGMNVIAFDTYPDDAFAKENSFTYLPLNELLSKSDIVTLHTPYNKETHHIINSDTIKSFKKGSYLINTARGELVDNKALLSALDEGILAGAGLDVVENNVKLNHTNVVVTPHIAYSTFEAEAEILRVTIESILNFIKNNN